MRTIFQSDEPIYVETAGDMVEIVRAREVHKYLGTTLPGDLTQRGTTTLTHRLQCAWLKFHLFRNSLTDKHVDKKMRTRLFNAVVTPSALYGLTACPLTVKSLSTLEVTQRKMLRLMFGWRNHCD